MVKTPKTSNRLKYLGRRALHSPMIMESLASLITNYFRLVERTTRFVSDPTATRELLDGLAPYIGVGWHGKFWFLAALSKRYGGRYDIVISEHVTAEVFARVLERFDVGTIRGAGSIDRRRIHDRRGLTVFRGMMRSLEAGRSVITSGDFDRRARREVARGIIKLAQKSGRPILPIAVATSKSFTIRSAWDNSTVNLPFSRGSLVLGDPIFIPPDFRRDREEELRRDVARGIDDANRKAFEIASRKR